MKLKRKLYNEGIISGRELKFNTYDPLGDRRIIKFLNKEEEENPELEEEDIEDDEDSEDETDKETLKEEEDYESES